MKEQNEYEEIELFSSSNDYQINEICAILTENNIPFIKNHEGVGSYMNLYMGNSFQEKKIFVSKDDYNKSYELISRFISNDIGDEKELIEESQQTENEKTSKTLTEISKIAISLVLILPIVIVILMIVLLLCQ